MTRKASPVTTLPAPLTWLGGPALSVAAGNSPLPHAQGSCGVASTVRLFMHQMCMLAVSCSIVFIDSVLHDIYWLSFVVTFMRCKTTNNGCMLYLSCC